VEATAFAAEEKEDGRFSGARAVPIGAGTWTLIGVSCTSPLSPSQTP
jgi:hypothetical protein